MFNRNVANQACLKSGQFIATLDQRQSPKIACLRETAWRNGLVTAEKLEPLAQPLAANGNAQYMPQLLAKGAQP